MNIFAKRLKELRKAHDMTQTDLALAIKISRSAVGEWESGRAKPQADMLETIADVLNTDINYLLGTEAEKKSELERRFIQAGLKDRINNLTPEQYEILINSVKNFKDKDN